MDEVSTVEEKARWIFSNLVLKDKDEASRLGKALEGLVAPAPSHSSDSETSSECQSTAERLRAAFSERDGEHEGAVASVERDTAQPQQIPHMSLREKIRLREAEEAANKAETAARVLHEKAEAAANVLLLARQKAEEKEAKRLLAEKKKEEKLEAKRVRDEAKKLKDDAKRVREEGRIKVANEKAAQEKLDTERRQAAQDKADLDEARVETERKQAALASIKAAKENDDEAAALASIKAARENDEAAALASIKAAKENDGADETLVEEGGIATKRKPEVPAVPARSKRGRRLKVTQQGSLCNCGGEWLRVDEPAREDLVARGMSTNSYKTCSVCHTLKRVTKEAPFYYCNSCLLSKSCAACWTNR
jgi:hypothetical protein